MKHQQENREAFTTYESNDSNDTKPLVDFIGNDQTSPLVVVEQQQSAIITINVPVSEISSVMLSDADLV